ncbi:hypothetical protein ACFORJ_11540 [Corynebacterium hansenii]|uniref:Uncharacterized protein n=2 Tax=Corynebacterium hansenii TaxID=394964 RepID=A0ABV7ZSE7_9CORY|nr:hypothetical protein CHAN_06590 [Corynebacterium hansenii]
MRQPGRFATIAVAVVLAASIVVQTAGNMADMFGNPWAWAFNIAGLAGALWLRKTWLVVLAAIAILWPIVVMVPLMAFFFGAP